jgi:tetratricopeptide (TPR) repeat protein
MTVLFPLCADVEVRRFERLLAEGKPEEAMPLIQRALERQPEQPRLWYNYGIAAYAAGRFDEALLALDKVETSRRPALIERARRQKGNAEFHLGWKAQSANLDETIHRWNRALDHYRTVLLRSPDDTLARTNHAIVRKLLLELLLTRAQEQVARAHQPGQGVEPQMDALRAAFDTFREAQRLDDASEAARSGERQTRAELARTLATQGILYATPQPALPAVEQTDRLRRGVNQLEDAHALLPADRPIEQQLEHARTSLAELLNLQARSEIEQAERTNAEPAKIVHLDRAIRRATSALDQQPQHQPARATLAEARQDLALIREKRGDENVRKAEGAPPEPQARRLETALREYQEALEWEPQDAAVRAKVTKIEQRLEAALRQLADTLVPDPAKQAGKPTESLEQKAARLEGAQHALHNLQQLSPDPATARRLALVEKQLARVRELAAGLEPLVETAPPTPAPPLPENVALPPTPRKPQPLAPDEFKSEPMRRPPRDY